MLSLAEQRVLLACIAQIDSTAVLTEEYRFEVTASGVADLAWKTFQILTGILKKPLKSCMSAALLSMILTLITPK